MIAALNAYYAPISREKFYWEMSLEDIQEAVMMARAKGMPDAVVNRIWGKETKPIKGFVVNDGRRTGI